MLGPSAEDQRKQLSLPHTGGHPFPLIHLALSFFFLIGWIFQGKWAEEKLQSYED